MSCALSCHTTHPYLFSRPHLGTSAVADELYAALTSRVGFDGPWAKQTPWYGQDGSQKARESLGSEAVLNAVTLALHDQARGRAPTPTTLRAVERMWEAQRSDGGFHWLDFGLEPWEAGNETWGAAMAALAAGLVGAETAGTESLRKFLKSRQSPTLHDRLAILWASTAMSGLADSDTLRDTFDAVVAAQAPSGGWSNAALIGSLPETGVDAYATAFATFVLCTFENAGRETGTVAPNQTAIGAGLTWLRKHQSSKGSWETTSANRESARGARFMTDAATAYAVLALTRCAP